MFEFFINNATFFIFVLALTIFLVIKKKNLQLQGSFPLLYILMYKTSLGLDKMDRWSKKHPRLFLNLSYLSIFIGVVGMVAMFIFMFWQLGFIIEQGIETGGGFVLPLKTDKGLDGAVPIFYVPFWYWLVALFILVIVHEFAHGVIAERFNIKIKSSGFAFLGILVPLVPAAFVEPDEKQLKKKEPWKQIAVLGAGSTSNFIFGFLFLLVFLFIAIPFTNQTMQAGPISFTEVLNESSLNQYDLESGTIVAFNDVEDPSLILEEFTNLTPNQTINLTIDSNSEVQSYELTTYNHPIQEGKGMIGISGISYEFENIEPYSWLGDFPLYFQNLIFYIWFLNIGIGMMNLLPIWITDGGQIARVLLEKKLKKSRAQFIYSFLSYTTLLLLIFTLSPSLLVGLLSLL